MRYPFVLLFAVLIPLHGCVAAAGAGSGVLMSATDRRSAGTVVEDDTIESKGQKRIDDKYKDAAHVSLTAFNRFALVTGTVANETAKMDIERIVGAIPNVKGIANELVVVKASIPDTRSGDSRITSNVKARFGKSAAFKTDHIKVVTENSVVYLMGLVTRAEADAASDIASTTASVAKVVRVFEYID